LGGNLSEIYSSEPVRALGKALNIAVRQNEDFASLVEFEYAEDEESFSEALKRFLRRYESQARKYERKKEDRSAYRPTEEDLRGLIDLVRVHGVPPVRSALVSYALVRAL